MPAARIKRRRYTKILRYLTVTLFVVTTLMIPQTLLATSSAAETLPAPNGPVVSAPVVPVARDIDLRTLPQHSPVKNPNRPNVKPLPQPTNGAQSVQNDPALQSKMGPAAMPAPIQNFAGLDFNNFGAGHPPDTNGDVGPTYYIQTVNVSAGIYEKATGNRVAAFTLDDFWATTGTACVGINQGDPVALYDALADRWLITDFGFHLDTNNNPVGPYYECIAVSRTGDPVTGGWYFYDFQADASTTFPDYPKLGVWPDGYYMSANLFANGQNSNGARVWALNRDAMINGQPMISVRFDLAAQYGGLLPSNLRGSLPPANSPNYFTAIDTVSDVLQLWKFHVDWQTPAQSTFTGPTNIPVSAFNVPASDVPQLNSSEKLDALADRLMMQLQYRNIGGVESLWVNHTVASNGVTGIRWYEIRNPNGTPSINQQGTFHPDTNNRWMGSLAVDGSGNMALGYSVSSSTMYPSIRYAGRLVSDPLNILGQAEQSLIEGTGAQNGGSGRWGDYSAMTIDPVDDCTFWYTTEYYAATGKDWQTRIGSFKYPSCGSAATYSSFLPLALSDMTAGW